MAWKQNGHPTVQMQRDKWVVRVDGIDTETGRRRPRQVGLERGECSLGMGEVFVRAVELAR